MLFSAFPVALQVDAFLASFAEVFFAAAFGVGIMIIMIAPFIRLLRDSERNELPQRKKTQSLEEVVVDDVKEELWLFNDSAVPSDFIYEDAS